jgi:hypothetical protein
VMEHSDIVSASSNPAGEGKGLSPSLSVQLQTLRTEKSSIPAALFGVRQVKIEMKYKVLLRYL